MKVAFAGLAHSHSLDLLDIVTRSENHTVAGIWEPNPVLRSAVENSSLYTWFASFQELLENGNADIIAVGSCFADRGMLTIKALQAGKHVIGDKPICTRTEELHEIRNQIKTKNLKLGCMLTMRYMQNVLAVRNLLQSGVMGELRTVYYGQQHPLFYGKRPAWYFEKDRYGGVINDIAIHGIDLIRFLTGQRLQSVIAARCWNAYATQEPDFADCGQFMISLNNGAGVLADVSYSIPSAVGYAFPTHWELFFERGIIRFFLNGSPAHVWNEGKKDPVLLEGIPPQTDFWNDFINEIQGKPSGILCTEEILTSTEDTLQIQEYADRQVEW